MIMKVIPDAVARREPVLLPGNASVTTAAKRMSKARIGAVLILENDRLAGIFTERDVSHRVVGMGLNPNKVTLQEVMTTDIKTIEEGDTVISVLEQMTQYHIRRMPVMSSGELVGMVGVREILACTIQQLNHDLEQMHVPHLSDCKIASDFIKERPVSSLPSNASVYHAAGLMKGHNIGSILVTRNKEIKGIFTERDVSFRVVAKGLNPDEVALSDVMTKDLVTVHPGESCTQVAQRMRDGHFRHLPIVEDGKTLGILSIRDLYDYIRNRLENEFKEAMINRTREMIAAP